jgi:hypothetical protein
VNPLKKPIIMRSTKTTVFVLFLFILWESCINKKKENNILTVNYSVLRNQDNKPLLFISCLRCSCFNNVLNTLYKKTPELLQRFTIYADSSCSGVFLFNSIIHHQPQSYLDSLFEENYNLVVIKKDNSGSYFTRLIETAESDRTPEILNQFQ